MEDQSQAPAALTQTQTQTIGGLEQTTPRKETTSTVVHRGDTCKETEKDGVSSGNISDLDQLPLSMLLQESSCLKGKAQRRKKRKVVQPLSIIGEKGVSSDSQPTLIQSVEAINCKGAATRGLDELEKSSIVVESSPSLEEHITADTELDVATRDEHNDMHLSWPFVKCSPLWEFFESLEVFRSMPQKLHFHPLEEYKMVLREGRAIACMVNFANLVENMKKSQIEDPLSQLQSWSKALDGLEEHGFNVQPIRTRLEKLIELKVNYEDFVAKTKSAEEQIRVLNDNEEHLTARLTMVDKEIRDQTESIDQLKKQLESTRTEMELHDSHLGELMTRRNQIRKEIGGVELEFDQSVASPW